MQILYAIDVTGTDPNVVIRDFWGELPGDAEGREYADEIVRGVTSTREVTDARIRAACDHWRIERMARVDCNLLRVGCWELAERLDVPRAVIIDEAVDLAKRFGSKDSGAFVNGVLDRIAEDCGR